MKVKRNFEENASLRELSFFIMAIPLGWFFGMRFFMFHVFTLYLFSKMLFQSRRFCIKKAIGRESVFLAAFIALYLFAILFNLNQIPASRLAATLYNLSFWGMGLFLIIIFRLSLSKKDTDAVLAASSIFGLITSIFLAFAYGYWFLSGGSYLAFYSPFFRILPQSLKEIVLNSAPLVHTSLVPSIIGRDKLFGKPFPRSPGFNIYPTALGLTMIILIGLTFAWYLRKKKDKKILALLCLEGLTLVLSLSRTAVLAFIPAALFVGSFVLFQKKVNRKIVAIVVLILVVLAMFFPYQKVINVMSSFRGESTASRIGLYRLTISKALERPILGHGFKPRTEEAPVPIGSHSTYIGVFYRTGILGTVAFLLFWFLIVRRWFRVRSQLAVIPDLVALWYGTGIGLFGGLLWMFTEDIDAPPIAAFFFFIVVALVLSLDRLAEEAGSRKEPKLSVDTENRNLNP